MSAPMLSLHHVSKFYGTVIGVGDLHLDLPVGAYGLIGPNGSGKSTLINLITGALKPSMGTVRVLDHNPRTQRRVLSRIGLCPASDILFPNVSALQWVTYLTTLHGFSTKEARRRAEQSLHRVGLKESLRQPIGTYSLGMRQRTKLAQSIAHSPELLILDEPFNGLDPIGRHELAQFLVGWTEERKSLILASHILHEVEAVTRSFLLIHGGRILASGDASEVRSMLAGIPVEVTLAGSGLDQLIQRAAVQPWMKGFSFADDRRQVSVQVTDQYSFHQFLTASANEDDICIESVDSPEESLDGAFNLLLRAHRGEG